MLHLHTVKPLDMASCLSQAVSEDTVLIAPVLGNRRTMTDPFDLRAICHDFLASTRTYRCDHVVCVRTEVPCTLGCLRLQIVVKLNREISHGYVCKASSVS